MSSKIIFDTDCISSFLWTFSTELLIRLYKGKIVISDIVYEELKKLKSDKVPSYLWENLEKMINNGEIEIYTIAIGEEATIKEYLRLIENNQIGKGEAATIAIAKTVKGYTASNNYKDIRRFIDSGEIENISTIDILCEAYVKKLKTIEELEKIKAEMIKRRRKLPSESMHDILKNRGLLDIQGGVILGKVK